MDAEMLFVGLAGLAFAALIIFALTRSPVDREKKSRGMKRRE